HVKKAFADTIATADWRLGAWSDTTGWPKTGGFFEQRLYVASTDDQSQTLWGSQTGDFENFKPDDDNNVVEDDDALDFTLSADSVNEIRWLSAGEDTLAIGTAGGEWVPSASGIVITPLDITIRRQTTHGSALVAPLRVDHVVLFVQRAKRKIREFVFNFEFDSFLAPDMTRLAQHITAPSIDVMAFQQEPDSLVWTVRSDGVMPTLTFRRDEDVVGWARHFIGGLGSLNELAEFTITGGSESAGVNQITSITVDGVELLTEGPIDFDDTPTATALAIVTQIIGSAGWNLAQASYDEKNFDFSVQTTSTSGAIRFQDDGIKMWVGDSSGADEILQYRLSTPWDVTTAIYDGFRLDVSSVVTVLGSFWFKPDGLRLYLLGGQTGIGGKILQYNLSTAWDLRSATDAAISSDVFALTPLTQGGFGAFYMRSDGKKFWAGGHSTGPGGYDPQIFAFSMSTAWDITTSTYDGVVLNVSPFGVRGERIGDVHFSTDGTVMFHVGIDDGI
ncbi:hypothetical protein LCGC14_2487220, partial [marine sediment metagenome]